MKRTKLELGITLILFVVVVSTISLAIVPVRADVSYGRYRTDRWIWSRWTNTVYLRIYHDEPGDPINDCTYDHITAVNHEDWVKQNKYTVIQIDPTLQDLWVKVSGSSRFYQHDGSPDLIITTWLKIDLDEIYDSGKSVTWSSGSGYIYKDEGNW